MKKVHISFGNERYYPSLDLLEKTSLELGKVDKFIRYTDDWIRTTDFYTKNRYIFDNHKTANWIWKSYIILETFNTLEYNDIVLYSDAGLNVLEDLSPLFDLTYNNKNGGKLLFKIPGPHINKTWTKRDCFILTGCDEEKYWKGILTNGAVSLWQKTDENIEYLKVFQKYTRDPRIITDEPNMCGQPNLLGFNAHRHDQSVLSLLTIKNNLELYRDPTQWGNDEIEMFSNSPYKQLFNHHRGQI